MYILYVVITSHNEDIYKYEIYVYSYIIITHSQQEFTLPLRHMMQSPSHIVIQ